MQKYIYICISVAFLAHLAKSLECYVTNVKLLQDNHEVYHRKRDCEVYFMEVEDKFQLNLDNDLTLSCYSMIVNTTEENKNFTLKGCAPKGYCGSSIKNLVENEVAKKGFAVANINCDECFENYCNV